MTTFYRKMIVYCVSSAGSDERAGALVDETLGTLR